MKPQHVSLKDHFLYPEFLRDWGVPTSTLLESRWMEAGGIRIHSRSSAMRGSPRFVLIHGLVISSLYMIPLAECLAAEFEVHALDLPGYGRSEKPHVPMHVPALADAVAKWLRASELGSCHIVGNSFGCQVGAELAVRHPERVTTLILVGPTVDPAAPRLFQQALRLLKDMPKEPFRLWLNHVVDYIRAGPRFAAALMRIMVEDRIQTKLPRISCPTLIVRGERDPIVPERWAREAVSLLPRGHLSVIPHGSHCVHYAAPGSVTEALLAFHKNCGV